MTEYYPSGKVYLGRVPYDSTYTDTILNYTSQNAQNSQMFNNMVGEAIEENAYTYIRANSSIKVNKNIEMLYNYNYVMYRNENYTTKWFYAFITNMQYINENCTELFIETDVIQTWFFEIGFHECFIEREHVFLSDDEFGNYLLPEPSFPMIYETKNFRVESAFPRYVVFLVNKLPTMYMANPMYPTVVMGEVPASAQSVSGGFYQNQFYGCLPIILDLTASQHVTEPVVMDMDAERIVREFLHDMDLAGIADSIITAYTIPEDTIDSNDLVHPTNDTQSAGYYAYSLFSGFFNKFTEFKVPAKNCLPYNRNFDINVPTSFRTYTPKNKKLLTYPYSFLTVGDFSGNEQDYRYEFWNHSGAVTPKYKFKDTRLINEEGTGYLTPLFYNGNEDEQYQDKGNKPFTYSYNNQISYMNDAFINWLSQNRIATAVSLASGIMSIPSGKQTNSIIKASSSHKYDMRGLNPRTGRLRTYNQVVDKQASVTEKQNEYEPNVSGLLDTIGDIDYQYRQPNMTKGNVSGNSKVQNGYAGFYIAERCLITECAQVIDNYFEMYGYHTMRLGIPQIRNRKYWNYIKTVNADFKGYMPEDVLDKINAIFNNGIRFWHTWDVGNYTLNNHEAL